MKVHELRTLLDGLSDNADVLTTTTVLGTGSIFTRYEMRMVQPLPTIIGGEQPAVVLHLSEPSAAAASPVTYLSLHLAERQHAAA